jgi:hypothetical protein
VVAGRRAGNSGREEAKAMRRIIEDQRTRILAKKEEMKQSQAQLTLGFDKMELLQLEEERKEPLPSRSFCG